MKQLFQETDEPFRQMNTLLPRTKSIRLKLGAGKTIR